MSRTAFPLALAGTFLLLVACAPAQMRVAPALSALEPFPVAGANPRRWNSQISFGPWKTSVAREGLKWDFGLPLLGVAAGYGTQPYRVVLASARQPIQAECVTRSVTLARGSVSVDPALGNLPALACGFTGQGDGTLRLRITATNAEKGRLEYSDAQWEVSSVDRLQGSPLPSAEPLGYEITSGNRVVAAVETLNQGRVWMDPALSARDKERLAATIAVLLLYPRET